MGISPCVVAVDIPSLDVKPQVVQISQSPFPHQNSISSLEPRPFHVGSIVLQVVFCELICTSKPCFVPTRCSSDEASRPTSNH